MGSCSSNLGMDVGETFLSILEYISQINYSNGDSDNKNHLQTCQVFLPSSTELTSLCVYLCC